ncbi:MAG: hypothetical protein QNJ53_05515 [Pleurocapsa sp. MO_192.B19]|nr:hypothetical protein [Pleurocapsa sp. MO_192.B19]
MVKQCGLGRGFQGSEVNSEHSPSAFRRGATAEPFRAIGPQIKLVVADKNQGQEL